MSIRVIGSSHHLAPPSRLQDAVSRKEALIAHLLRLQAEQRIAGAVLLATCNRLEIVLDANCSDPGLRDVIFAEDVVGAGADLPCHDHGDLEAAHYLLRVAAGLESMVRGEDQILGQLREAFKLAEKHGLLSSRLRVLRNHLVSAARDIRQRTGLSKSKVSVASLAARQLERAGTRLVVVGAGETGRLAVETLMKRGRSEVLLVNRTLERAQALAGHFGIEAMSLREFLATASGEANPGWDGMLLAVDSPVPLIEAEHVRGMRMVVDVSMPCVLADGVRRGDSGPEILDLDAIARLVQEETERRTGALDVADDIVAGRARSLHQALAKAGSGAHLAQIFELHVETALREVQTTLDTSLRHLSAADQAQVREAVLRVTRRNAHLHIKDVRDYAERA